jgi:hypothetical protein
MRDAEALEAAGKVEGVVEMGGAEAGREMRLGRRPYLGLCSLAPRDLIVVLQEHGSASDEQNAAEKELDHRLVSLSWDSMHFRQKRRLRCDRRHGREVALRRPVARAGPLTAIAPIRSFRRGTRPPNGAHLFWKE